ncbi:hypothetical protein RsoM2USA_72 [Ralstonia phage RsoM2USA]|nr:hypothetical protein RsoM2USA_72 [Ralstonia phage RsoM2USA]
MRLKLSDFSLQLSDHDLLRLIEFRCSFVHQFGVINLVTHDNLVGLGLNRKRQNFTVLMPTESCFIVVHHPRKNLDVRFASLSAQFVRLESYTKAISLDVAKSGFRETMMHQISLLAEFLFFAANSASSGVFSCSLHTLALLGSFNTQMICNFFGECSFLLQPRHEIIVVHRFVSKTIHVQHECLSTLRDDLHSRNNQTVIQLKDKSWNIRRILGIRDSFPTGYIIEVVRPLLHLLLFLHQLLAVSNNFLVLFFFVRKIVKADFVVIRFFAAGKVEGLDAGDLCNFITNKFGSNFHQLFLSGPINGIKNLFEFCKVETHNRKFQSFLHQHFQRFSHDVYPFMLV